MSRQRRQTLSVFQQVCLFYFVLTHSVSLHIKMELSSEDKRHDFISERLHHLTQLSVLLIITIGQMRLIFIITSVSMVSNLRVELRVFFFSRYVCSLFC